MSSAQKPAASAANTFIPVCNLNRLALIGFLTLTGRKREPYYQCGLYIDSKEGWLVSTNGYATAILDLGLTTGAEPFIVSRELIKAILNKAPRDAEITVHVQTDANTAPRRIKLITGRHEVSDIEVIAAFPKYEDLLPKTCISQLAQYDPTLVDIMRKAVAAICGERNTQIEILQNGAEPALVTTPNARLMGVLRPLPPSKHSNSRKRAMIMRFRRLFPPHVRQALARYTDGI